MVTAISPSIEQVRSQFVELMSGLVGRLSRRFRRRDPEAKDDALAEGVGHAWMMFLAGTMKGKTLNASTLAFFAGRMVEAGRKVVGMSSRDALSDTAVSRRRQAPAVSLDASSLSHASFYRTFGDKRWRWPVIDYVAPRLDMQAFQAQCCTRDRLIMNMKVRGVPQNRIAAELGVSSPAISQRLRALRCRWDAMSAG